MKFPSRILFATRILATTLSLNAATVVTAQAKERQISNGEHQQISMALKAARAAAETTGIGCARGIAVIVAHQQSLFPTTKPEPNGVSMPALVLTALGHGKIEVNLVKPRYTSTIIDRRDIMSNKDSISALTAGANINSYGVLHEQELSRPGLPDPLTHFQRVQEKTEAAILKCRM